MNTWISEMTPGSLSLFRPHFNNSVTFIALKHLLGVVDDEDFVSFVSLQELFFAHPAFYSRIY